MEDRSPRGAPQQPARSRFAIRAAWLAALLALSASCAVGVETRPAAREIDSVGESEDTITRGTPTEGDPAVVGLVYSSGDRRALRCTGTLLARTWVITAAHCIEPAAPDTVAFGGSLDESVEWPVRDAVAHPRFDPESLEHDVALLELALPAPERPLGVHHPAGDTDPRPGDLVRLVGFGRSDTATPPLKRTGTARISDVAAHTFTVEPSPSLTCAGDSGGPALWRAGDEEVLVGVVSKGDWECQDHSIFTHIAAAERFLDETMRGQDPASGGCAVHPGGAEERLAGSFVLPLLLLLAMIARGRDGRSRPDVPWAPRAPRRPPSSPVLARRCNAPPRVRCAGHTRASSGAPSAGHGAADALANRTQPVSRRVRRPVTRSSSARALRDPATACVELAGQALRAADCSCFLPPPRLARSLRTRARSEVTMRLVGSLLLSTVIVGLSLSGAPLIAHADGPATPAARANEAPDEVLLRNGGMVRGTVISSSPGEEVVIAVPGLAEPRRIPWAEVGDVQLGKHAAKPAAAPAPAAPGYDAAEDARPAAPNAPGVVRLHIDSEQPVELHEHIGSSAVVGPYGGVLVTHSRVVCTSPCDQVVDARRGQRFVVAGDGVPASPPFQLGNQRGDVDVRVDPGSSGRRVGGVLLTTLGGAGVLYGVLGLVMGATLEESDSTTRDIKDTMMVTGGVALGVGAATLIGGIVLLATSGTKIDLAPKQPGKDTARRSAAAPRYLLGQF